MNKFDETLLEIKRADSECSEKARKWLDSRMKPVESLGFLEKLAIKIAGITGKEFYEIGKTAHIVASSDNGVVEEGVSSCPVEYTRIVSEAMLSEMAAIGILCKSLGIDLKVVDVGIASDLKGKYNNFIDRKISYGSRNFFKEPAMTREQCIAAIEVGIGLIEELAPEYDLFSNGEMGIGNTTTSSAILYALTGEPIDKIVGRGGGLSDAALDRKKRIIVESVGKYGLFNAEPIEVLATVGGYDIACMVGMYLGAARMRKPMIVDGFISAIAALAAVKLAPEIEGYLIASHISEEPGMRVIIDLLKLDAPLHMNMRLGEGTGAVFVHGMARCSTEILRNMKTRDEVYKLFN